MVQCSLKWIGFHGITGHLQGNSIKGKLLEITVIRLGYLGFVLFCFFIWFSFVWGKHKTQICVCVCVYFFLLKFDLPAYCIAPVLILSSALLTCACHPVYLVERALAKSRRKYRVGCRYFWAEVLQCGRDSHFFIVTQIRSTCPPFMQHRAVLNLPVPMKYSQLLPPHNLSGFFEVCLQVHLTYIATYCPPLSLTEELLLGGVGRWGRRDHTPCMQREDVNAAV